MIFFKKFLNLEKFSNKKGKNDNRKHAHKKTRLEKPWKLILSVQNIQKLSIYICVAAAAAGTIAKIFVRSAAVAAIFPKKLAAAAAQLHGLHLYKYVT